jgi:hypothetical protein
MLLVLANLFFFSLGIGGDGARFIVLTFQIGNAEPVQYDLLQLLLVLGISILAAVILERLLWRGTPGGLVGAFFISLIGIWLFITFVPLIWKGDISVDGIPLFTAIIGAILSLLIVHMLFGRFRRRSGWRRKLFSGS